MCWLNIFRNKRERKPHWKNWNTEKNVSYFRQQIQLPGYTNELVNFGGCCLIKKLPKRPQIQAIGWFQSIPSTEIKTKTFSTVGHWIWDPFLNFFHHNKFWLQQLPQYKNPLTISSCKLLSNWNKEYWQNCLGPQREHLETK